MLIELTTLAVMGSNSAGRCKCNYYTFYGPSLNCWKWR